MQIDPFRVSLAEDDRDVAHRTRAMLEEPGHQVVSVSMAGECLVQKCLELKPDLAVIDIIMPDMDGLKAASEIRSRSVLTAARPRPQSTVLTPFMNEGLIVYAGMRYDRS